MTLNPTPSSKVLRRLWPWLLLGVLLLASWLWMTYQGPQGNRLDPNVAWRPLPTSVEPKPESNTSKLQDWPRFGGDLARSQFSDRIQPRAPFRQRWAYRGSLLLEFTPVLCTDPATGQRTLFLMRINGALHAVDADSGKLRFKRKLGDLAAASPTCDAKHGRVFVTLLRAKSSQKGKVMALSSRSGKTLWQRDLADRSESSPLLLGSKLFFGNEAGEVQALRASSGKLLWRHQASGAVKGALSYQGGQLFFGDYSGRVSALNPKTGALQWRSSSDSRLGLRWGNFYASPSAGWGRVYAGNVDGSLYSFAQSDGQLAWRRQLGRHVYATPALAEVKKLGPTVFVGDYKGVMWALNARDGSVRWQRHLGQAISGTATVLGDTVWVSDIRLRRSWMLSARSGRTLWTTRRGGYMTAISDGQSIFFNGYTSMFRLDPKAS